MFATQQLRDEHEGIEIALAVLEMLAEDLQAGRDVNTEHLREILDFLTNFADRCHHGKEEDLLFPALNAVGIPTEGGPVGVMLHEHEQGRAYIKGMKQALEAMDAGHDARQEFAVNALGYVELLRAHINKENNVLFMMAEQALPPAEHERLAAAFDKMEEEHIGPGVHERYHEWLHMLRDRYLKQAA